MKSVKGISLICVVLLLAASLVCTSRAGAAEDGGVSIGYVNLQKALNESLAGRQAMDGLKEEAGKQDEDLNARQEELKKFKEEIEKKGTLWSQEVRRQKEGEFNAKREEFQAYFYKSQDALQAKKKEREAVIIKDLIEVMKRIAKEKGYTYVFEVSAGGLLVGPLEADFTNDVIVAYDSKFKGEKK